MLVLMQKTQVNIAAGKTIDVARTDGTDKGGVWSIC